MNRRELIDKSTWGMRRKRGATFMRNKLGLIVGAAALFSATPLLAQRGDEPVAVPSKIKQGIDFVYVDPDMSNIAQRHQKPRNWLARLFNGGDEAAATRPTSLFAAAGRRACSNTADLGQPAADQDSRGPGAQARARPASGCALLRTRLGLGARQRLRRASCSQRVSELPARPRPRPSRRHRRQGHHRLAQPGRGVLREAHRDQHGARLAPAGRPGRSTAISSSIPALPRPTCSTATEWPTACGWSSARRRPRRR